MRLRTFESFWLLKNGLLYSYPSLQEDLDTEILVVGAGITGALISQALIEAGYQVMLVDKRDIGQGSTAATTSMLQYEIDVPLADLAGKIGEKEAVTCYQAGMDAIKKMEVLIQKQKIDCGFERKQSLYLAHDSKAVDNLYREFQIRKRYLPGIEWLTTEFLQEKYGLYSPAGILSHTAASVDAYKLAHELIQQNTKRGLRVFDQTHIDKFELDQENPQVITETGQRIRFSKLIFCTGFETTSMLEENVARLFDTYACVSEQQIKIPDTLRDTLLWDTDDPYLYMRTTDDGRLLVGGEDSSTRLPFFQQKIKEKKGERLIKKLNAILPGIDFVEDFSWGGTFGSTQDGLPYIGASPEYPNAYFVLGFGGNGITFSIQGMEIIVDLLQGRENRLAEYYRFGR